MYNKINFLFFTVSPRRFKSYRCIITALVILHVFIIALVFERKYITAVDELTVPNDNLPEQKEEIGNRLKVSTTHRDRFDEVDDVRHDKPVERLDRTTCNYRTTAYLNDKAVVLDQPPFLDYTRDMVCLENGNIAAFSDRFVLFKNALLDPSKTTSARRGGEKMEEVWDQREQDEYFEMLPGYFKVSCATPPMLRFQDPDHLVQWHRALSCYKANETDLSKYNQIHGFTLAIQRYEYVNLYHTMTDFYNAFVLMLIFGHSSSKVNILFVDAHPAGTLDEVWSTLFSKYIRAGQLPNTTGFSTLAWGMLGYFSPLNSHELDQVPYLTEFRDFFLGKHSISASHVINCQKLNVVIIWRRDYVAHPRNKQGSVVRKFDNEQEIVDQVRKTLGESSNITGIQLDAMHMKAQLEAIAKCDILMGMHGAGLSHILFLPQTSGVIELKPSYSNPALMHFEAMARWRKIPYSVWVNGDPANEKPSYRTYIPPSVIESEINYMYAKICETQKMRQRYKSIFV